MARAPCFVVLFGILFATPARGQLPDLPATGFKSNIDKPNPAEVLRTRQRQSARSPRDNKSGNARALVILVEFAGTDSFDFIPTGNNKSTWDPLGVVDSTEWAGAIGDCSNIVKKLNLTATKTFTYTGPLHNKIPRPLSAADRSGESIWSEDFARQHYQDLLFGDGLNLKFRRADGSEVNVDLTGKSLRGFYKDMSGGLFSVDGEVFGWVQVPHSIWWYAADPCPGARSAPSAYYVDRSGGIPNAGNINGLVRDALDALRRANPTLDWKSFDTDNDGVIDNLWVIHAGMGEEDSPTLLARTDYGEGGIWSSAGSLSAPYPVAPGVAALQYSVLPENAGASVSAHEFAHNLGAHDLYAYRGGQTSVGMWSLMSDSWTGSPTGIVPGPFDPLHLDQWGWLNPRIINDPGQESIVKIGQVSNFRSGSGVERGVKIELPDGLQTLAVSPRASRQWWAGRLNLADARMTLARPLAIPTGTTATLSFDLAYNLDPRYDYFWVQVSADAGRTWKTLTNANTTCSPFTDWIGGMKGFTGNLCAQGIGGFTGASKAFPQYATETFNLTPYAGQDVLIRLWSMTDWNYQLDGAFVDNVVVRTPSQILLSDDAESGDANWTYTEGWTRLGKEAPYKQAYYLQWRNPTATGGFDAALGDGYRFGPVPGGLLVWYYCERYTDNETTWYLFDPPSFGPKGMLLVVDAHPNPVRDPRTLAFGFENEGANLASRQQMRDATFSLYGAPDYSLSSYYASLDMSLPGLPANPRFFDAWGYTAGIERTSRGPGYDPPRWEWISRQWDASVVLPSTQNYAPLAPGYPAGEGMRYNCTANTTTGQLSCAELVKDRGFEKAGGGGNPGDVNGQYGWNVEILEQTETQATVRIWNDRNVPLPPRLAIDAPAPGAEVSGAIQIEVTAVDDQTIASVELFANGASKGIATEAPFWPAWDTPLDSNGVYSITLRACDTAGLCADTTSKLTVRNPEAPWVRITSPKPGAAIAATVDVTAEVAGDTVNVQLYVDGNLVAEAPSAGAPLAWDTTQSSPGLHTLTVLASNADGRTGVASVTVYLPRS